MHTIVIEWMVEKQPLVWMVLWWFLVWQTIGSNGFTTVFSFATTGSNSFFDGIVVRQPLELMVFQWFPMVTNHWSNDGMVTIHRYGQNQSHPIPYHPSHLMAFCTNMQKAKDCKNCEFFLVSLFSVRSPWLSLFDFQNCQEDCKL